MKFCFCLIMRRIPKCGVYCWCLRSWKHVPTSNCWKHLLKRNSPQSLKGRTRASYLPPPSSLTVTNPSLPPLQLYFISSLKQVTCLNDSNLNSWLWHCIKGHMINRQRSSVSDSKSSCPLPHNELNYWLSHRSHWCSNIPIIYMTR